MYACMCERLSGAYRLWKMNLPPERVGIIATIVQIVSTEIFLVCFAADKARKVPVTLIKRKRRPLVLNSKAWIYREQFCRSWNFLENIKIFLNKLKGFVKIIHVILYNLIFYICNREIICTSILPVNIKNKMCLLNLMYGELYDVYNRENAQCYFFRWFLFSLSHVRVRSWNVRTIYVD